MSPCPQMRMSSRLVSLLGSATFNFFKISKWTLFLKEDATRLKLGLALRLISKGLFYIRAMGLTFLFSDLRWARSTYSFFFAMNDDIDEPSFLQSRPSSHTLHLVTFGCYNPHCVTWCHFCKKIEKKSVWKENEVLSKA